MSKLILDYTRRCNSRCKTCNIWAIKDQETLGLEYIEKLLSQYSGIGYMFVTGGEPYMDDDVIEVARIFKHYHPNAVWDGATNCIDPDTERRMAAIKSLGVHLTVNISLEGDEQQHDATRGIEGSYRRCMEVIDFLKVESIPFIISAVTREGEAEGRRLGHTTYYNHPRNGERFGGYSKHEEILKPIPNCQGGIDMAVCTPSGDLYACEHDYREELRFGNIKEQNIDEMKWDEVHAYVRSGACSPCSMSCWFPR